MKKKGRYTKLDIIEMLKKSGGTLDREIYIGGNRKNRMKVRIVAIRLPEEVVNECRRKANKKAQSSNKTLTAASC
ncbi:hypothetical protein V6C42_12180 [Pseudoclostridium thermosuccinogenes]|jgi:hypothetical protein|uniref:hypothetical protein n=1 Tax=Clostridium thermosuccinogenes TaxID=84032 RepID=UPI002FDAF602